MTSIAEGLFKSLPKPKYTGENEELPSHAQPRGPRIVGADAIDESQVVLRVSFVYVTVYTLLKLKTPIANNSLSFSREPDHPSTANEQDGVLETQKITEMVAHSQKSP